MLGIGSSLSYGYLFTQEFSLRCIQLLFQIFPQLGNLWLFSYSTDMTMLMENTVKKKYWPVTYFSLYISSCQLGLFQSPSHISFLCLPFIMFTDHGLLHGNTERKWEAKIKIPHSPEKRFFLCLISSFKKTDIISAKQKSYSYMNYF